jgi:hypothetical protein
MRAPLAIDAGKNIGPRAMVNKHRELRASDRDSLVDVGMWVFDVGVGVYMVDKLRPSDRGCGHVGV